MDVWLICLLFLRGEGPTRDRQWMKCEAQFNSCDGMWPMGEVGCGERAPGAATLGRPRILRHTAGMQVGGFSLERLSRLSRVIGCRQTAPENLDDALNGNAEVARFR